MIQQERDPAFVNRIVNSAAVRPFVDYTGTTGPLDLSPAVGRSTQTGIVWLSNGEDALVAFPQTGDREYEAHLFFADTCRGRRALNIAREMIEWMRPCADVLWGAIPTRHKAALWFAKQLGFLVTDTENYELSGPVTMVARRLV